MSEQRPGGARPAGPVLSTTRVRLRGIRDLDSAFLYDLMTDPRAGGRVRFGGATPSPDKVAASLWDSVLAQFVVDGVASRRPLGLVAVTSPSLRDGYAYLSAVAAPTEQGLGLVAEAALLTVNYAFLTWPFRKLYMEVTETSYEGFRSGLGRYFAEEGRLRQHAFWDGGYVDLLLLAVYRETWARHQLAMLRLLGAVPGGT